MPYQHLGVNYKGERGNLEHNGGIIQIYGQHHQRCWQTLQEVFKVQKYASNVSIGI